MLIVLEGLDFSGKTSVAIGLEEWLRRQGHLVKVTNMFCGAKSKDTPPSASLGSYCRHALLYGAVEITDKYAEQMLFMASITESITKEILPWLQAGHVCIADRLYASNFVYAVFGRGLDKHRVASMLQNALPQQWPCALLEVLLDLPVPAMRARMAASGRPMDSGDSWDSEYYERVRQGYLAMFGTKGANHVTINADRDRLSVLGSVVDAVRARGDLLPKAGRGATAPFLKGQIALPFSN